MLAALSGTIMFAAIGIVANYLGARQGVAFGIALFAFGLFLGIYAWSRGDITKIDEAENEKLKQRLESVIKEIVNLMKKLGQNSNTGHFLQDKAENYLIQRWLDVAKISLDDPNKYFSDCNCLPAEDDLVKNCYILLYAEDWINNSKTLDYLFRNARTFFLGGIQHMCETTGIPTDIKITPTSITAQNEKLFGSKSFKFLFKYYTLEEALARNGVEVLDPTNIVMRVKKSLKDVKDYLVNRGLLKEEAI